MEQYTSGAWNRFYSDLENLNISASRLVAKYVLLLTTDQFSLENGLPTLSINLERIGAEIDALDTQNKHLNLAYLYTQRNSAGVRQNATDPSDFDIVVWENQFTKQQISESTVDLAKLDPSNELGIAPFIIAAAVGIVALVTGAVVTVSVMQTRQQELEAAVDQAQIALEKQITTTPEILPAWTQYKQTTQGQARGAIDKLLGEGAGASILAGAGGLLAVLVGGYFLFKMLDRKKARNA